MGTSSSVPASEGSSNARRSGKKPFYRSLWGQVLLGITLVIFCTVVTGIASMHDMKKVGRVGGKALLYFEIVSTLALLVGMVVGNLVHTGAGFNADPAVLDVKAVAGYAGAAKTQTISDFLLHIIPTT